MIKIDKKTDINPVATAAVAGAVVGAGMAIAGTIAMKDKKNRTKVKKFLKEAKGQVSDYAENASKSLEDQGKSAAKQIAKKSSTAKKKS